MAAPLRILFVCARNHWRSPTAEQVYRQDPRVEVRSAGVSARSPHAASAADLDWAHLVLAMERRHLARLREAFPGRADFPPMESLEIPDDYRFMDPELIQLIRAGTEPFLAALPASPDGGRR
jgi:predicted protein tyrosine phosphatase